MRDFREEFHGLRLAAFSDGTDVRPVASTPLDQGFLFAKPKWADGPRTRAAPRAIFFDWDASPPGHPGGRTA